MTPEQHERLLKIRHRWLSDGASKILGYLQGPIGAAPFEFTEKAAKFAVQVEEAVPEVKLYVPHSSVILQAMAPREDQDWFELDGAILSRCDFSILMPQALIKGVSIGSDAETTWQGRGQASQSGACPHFHSINELAAWVQTMLSQKGAIR